MQLDRINRHVETPYRSLEDFKEDLVRVYHNTKSTSKTGIHFNVTKECVNFWLRDIGASRFPRGGANNKGKLVKKLRGDL